MSLTYVSVLTDEGMLKVPNSSLLAAAVGPWDRPAPMHQQPTRAEPPVAANGGRGSRVHRGAG